MLSLLMRCMAAALLTSTPVLLRYNFKVHQVFRYRIEDRVTTTVRVGSEPESAPRQQETRMRLRREVRLTDGMRAAIEELVDKGVTSTRTTTGTVRHSLPDEGRICTLVPTGSCITFERTALAGGASTKARFMDGFALSLSPDPVRIGGQWSIRQRVTGLDGRPLSITGTSRYVNRSLRGGRICDRVEAEFQSTFRTSSPNPVDGALTGHATYFLAQDIGQNLESRIDYRLIVRSTVLRNGRSLPAVTVTRRSIHQELIP